MDELDTRLDRAELLLETGRPEPAEELARSLIGEHPDLPRAHSLLCSALTHQGRTDEALGPAREALRLAPDQAEMHVSLSIVLCTAGRHEEGATHGRRAVQLLPHSATCHYVLAHAIIDGHLTERLAEGLRAVEESIRLEPADPAAHNLLGLAHRLAGDREAARTAYLTALELDPDNPPARSNLATLDLGAGRVARGADGMLAALASDPQHDLLQKNLRILLARLGAVFTALWVLSGTTLGLMLAFGAASSTRLGTGVVWVLATAVVATLAWRTLPRAVRRSPRRTAGFLERFEKILLVAQAVPVVAVATMAFAPTVVAVISGCTVLGYVILLTVAMLLVGDDDD